MFRSILRAAPAVAIAAMLEFASAATAVAAPPAAPAPPESTTPPSAAGPATPDTIPDSPANPAALPAPDCGCNGFDWTKVPRGKPLPPIGNFSVLQTGPGYYSLLDQLRGNDRDAPPRYPYPRFGVIQSPFFEVDNFSYLDNPANTDRDIFDPLKRVHIGNNWLFTTGGDYRTRYMNEYNSRLTQQNNNYDLNRVRVYTDLWYRDDFRVFAEYLGAWTTSQTLAPLPIDVNKSDFLNLFVDAKIANLDGNPAYVRVGRQELLFGSQRLISPLDWANTRRTFQGVRAFQHTDKWDFDLFWVQPVIANANRLDSVDNNQNFVGAWATYRPKKGQTIDAYYLMLDNTNNSTTLGIQRGQFTRHTFGGRYVGNVDNFLFDAEGAMQLGSQSGRDVVAGMTTAGLGYNFKDALWNPTVWAYYDYASGGGATTGTDHTFNQLFPFGHYYLGWLDLVGRQNIHDLNFHFYLYPTRWVTTWLQFHSFWLADRSDALYNAAGVPIRISPNGGAGSHVGEELDLVYNFHLSTHADILTGYSYLWGGEFLRKTSGPTAAPNAGLYFLQYTYRW